MSQICNQFDSKHRYAFYLIILTAILQTTLQQQNCVSSGGFNFLLHHVSYLLKSYYGQKNERNLFFNSCHEIRILIDFS